MYRSSPTSPRAAGSTIHPHETRGNQHAMPCHDAFAGALDGCSDKATIGDDNKAVPVRTRQRGGLRG
jgi:hypothetical protein